MKFRFRDHGFFRREDEDQHPHSWHHMGADHRRGRGPGRIMGRGRGWHGHHHHHHHGGEEENLFAMKRLLAHGDLRYVVLLLIEEQPRHGYELIKLIETKSSGQYAPSPGVIYPTLTFLEETGLVKNESRDDKKQYALTAEGKEHLDQNRESARAILERLEQMGARLASARAEAPGDFSRHERLVEFREIFHELKHALMHNPAQTVKRKKEILEVLSRGLAEIRALMKEEK